MQKQKHNTLSSQGFYSWVLSKFKDILAFAVPQPCVLFGAFTGYLNALIIRLKVFIIGQELYGLLPAKLCGNPEDSREKCHKEYPC